MNGLVWLWRRVIVQSSARGFRNNLIQCFSASIRRSTGHGKGRERRSVHVTTGLYYDGARECKRAVRVACSNDLGRSPETYFDEVSAVNTYEQGSMCPVL